MARSSKILLASGIILLCLSSAWRLYQIYTLSFIGQYSLAPQGQESNNPVRITIPFLNLDLSVEEAQIVDNIWQVSKTGVSHLSSSADPGSGGNIVIYAHNKKNLFGPLLRVKKGDLINIQDETGVRHSYMVIETKIVSPREIGYVLPGNEEILTLYTCTGLADSKRFIVQAKPV